MEDGLLIKRNDDDENNIEMKGGFRMITGVVLWEEFKKLGYIAGPMVAVTLSVYLLQIASVMMVGHLGELALSSTSIAFSLAGVTGFSVMVSSPFHLRFYFSGLCYLIWFALIFLFLFCKFLLLCFWHVCNLCTLFSGYVYL